MISDQQDMSGPHQQDAHDRPHARTSQVSNNGLTSRLVTDLNLQSQDEITDNLSPRTVVSFRLRSLNLDFQNQQYQPRAWNWHDEMADANRFDNISHISETPPGSQEPRPEFHDPPEQQKVRTRRRSSPIPPSASFDSNIAVFGSPQQGEMTSSKMDGPSPAKKARIEIPSSDAGDEEMLDLPVSRIRREIHFESVDSITTIPETPQSSPPRATTADVIPVVTQAMISTSITEPEPEPVSHAEQLSVAEVVLPVETTPTAETTPKAKKRNLSPPPQRNDQTPTEPDPNLWWREDEIMGIYPSDPDEDNEGVNGVGYQKSRAEAWRIGQLRKKQIEDWRIREQRDARIRRRNARGGSGEQSEHRVMLGRVSKSNSRSGSPVEKRSPQSVHVRVRADLEQEKNVRFMIDE